MSAYTTLQRVPVEELRDPENLVAAWLGHAVATGRPTSKVRRQPPSRVQRHPEVLAPVARWHGRSTDAPAMLELICAQAAPRSLVGEMAEARLRQIVPGLGIRRIRLAAVDRSGAPTRTVLGAVVHQREVWLFDPSYAVVVLPRGRIVQAFEGYLRDRLPAYGTATVTTEVLLPYSRLRRAPVAATPVPSDILAFLADGHVVVVDQGGYEQALDLLEQVVTHGNRAALHHVFIQVPRYHWEEASRLPQTDLVQQPEVLSHLLDLVSSPASRLSDAGRDALVAAIVGSGVSVHVLNQTHSGNGVAIEPTARGMRTTTGGVEIAARNMARVVSAHGDDTGSLLLCEEWYALRPPGAIQPGYVSARPMLVEYLIGATHTEVLGDTDAALDN